MKQRPGILVASLCASLFLIIATHRVFAAGQPGNPAQNGKVANIVGIWESKSSQGTSTLLLNADGSGEFNGKELGWALAQNILSLTFQGGGVFKYKASLTGNTLTVSSPDLKEPLTFTRSGSGEPEADRPVASAGLGAISSGATTTAASGPEGTWHVQKPGGTFTLVLEPGGSGRFNNDHVDWKLTKGILILRWDSGDTFMYDATLTARTLKVTGGNLPEPITFERVGSHAPSGLAAVTGGNAGAAGSAARANPGGGRTGPVGDWITPSQTGVVHLGLNPDGSGLFGGGSIRWTFNQDVLTLTGPNGNPITYNTSMGADSMTLSGGGLDSPVTFRRSGGGSAESEEGAEPALSSGGGLVGSWQGQNGNLKLNADGSAVYNGISCRYSAQGGILTLAGTDGEFPLPYTLSGDTLTLTIRGQRANFTRGTGAQNAPATGGSQPADMMGKWCYYSGSSTGQIISGNEQCFTLSPNGTYTYYGASDSTNQYGGTASQSSDSGTWSLNGSTLSVNSQKQGPLTYSLEKRNNKNNDPMLCLDGQCFVTYEQRAPWPY